MFQYNANTGGFPKLGDRVRVVRSDVALKGDIVTGKQIGRAHV